MNNQNSENSKVRLVNILDAQLYNLYTISMIKFC